MMSTTLLEAGLPTTISVGENHYRTEIVLTGDEVQGRVEEMGHELAERYDERGEVHALTVLNGAMHFASDVRRYMQRANPALKVTSDQIKVSSYAGTRSSGILRFQGAPPADIAGKHLLIFEDVLDSGLTLDWLLKYMASHEPASVEIAVALVKNNSERKLTLFGKTAVHAGFNLTNDFVVGYGLDIDGQYRDLDGIYKLQPVTPAQI